MRFWEEMQSKYGFSDGNVVPDGADLYRTVYIRAVNQLAEQLNSRVRAVAYDRAGVHNWCLILFFNLIHLIGRTPADLTESADALDGDVQSPDEAMNEAIQQAYLLDLDSFIEVSITVVDDFDVFVATLYPVQEGDPLIADVNGQPQHIYAGGLVRLVRDVNSVDGTLLPAGSEYAVIWVRHHPSWIGLATALKGQLVAMTPPDAVMVMEIPAEERAESENCQPIPPFHLRDLDDETLDNYGIFYDWTTAQTAMRRAAHELGKSVQIINGYSNTVLSCDPDDTMTDANVVK
jgi:hypothetical protein